MGYTVESAFYIAAIISIIFGMVVYFAVKHGKFLTMNPLAIIALVLALIALFILYREDIHK